MGYELDFIKIFLPIFLAIFGALAKLWHNQSKHDAKLTILWEAYREEARLSAMRRGAMSSSSEYRLTEKGESMLSQQLKDDVRNLLGTKNPGKVAIWDAIRLIGGIPRLSEEAKRLDISLQEIIAMVEVYIRHLK